MVEAHIRNDDVWAWVSQCQRGESDGLGYAMSATASEPTIMSLCFAICIAELYDIPHRTGSGWWRRVLGSVQDPATGLFVDPLLSSEDLASESPGRDYLVHQTSYYALAALDALSCKSRYPLRFVEPFFDPAYAEHWLEQLDWSDPWLQSNWVMFVATALYAAWQWQGERTAQLALHRLLDWLDAHQDPETGFWGMEEGASLLHAMAGAYHFLPFYFCLDRPLHFPEAMIENTLALQQPDGLFHPEGGGDTCMDVDAVDILVKCSLITPYRSAAVETALERAFYGLVNSRSPDGGFCRARNRPVPAKSWKRRLSEPLGLDRLLRKPYEPPKEVWYYSGWLKMPFDIRESDLWSTWFRSFGLAVISVRYPGRYLNDADWVFRRAPALGWHDNARILQCCFDAPGEA